MLALHPVPVVTMKTETNKKIQFDSFFLTIFLNKTMEIRLEVLANGKVCGSLPKLNIDHADLFPFVIYKFDKLEIFLNKAKIKS